MRRKDMKPGVLYAINYSGNFRPGLIFDAKTERIRARVYWTWPGTLWPYDSQPDPERLETDYLNPSPAITDPRAKYDDRIIRTNDVVAEWEPWALQERADRDQRWADHLAKEQQEKDDLTAFENECHARLDALAPLLEGVEGYLSIGQLRSRIKQGWTRDYFSARDIVTLLEQVAGKVQA